jgi:hypothetical protein
MALDLFVIAGHTNGNLNYALQFVDVFRNPPLGRETKGAFVHNRYTLPHDALVFSGACGHGLIKTMLFGSKVEIAQATLTDSMPVSGPHCVVSLN